jgi:hypothetical protein
MILTGIFCLLFLTTSIFLYLSVKKNLEFLEQQEKMLELFEESLRELDVCHKKIDKKAKLELFSNDAIVKELVDDIKKSRLTVAALIEELTDEKELIKNIQNVD